MLIVAGLLGGTGLLALHLRGQQLLSVQSASMRPSFQPGDALIVNPVKTIQLRLGQVISYHSPQNPNFVLSHRLSKINPRTGWLTTKGDALPNFDQSFPPNLLVGQVSVVAPGLGRLLDLLHEPLGLALVIYLPALILVISKAIRLPTQLDRPDYQAFGYGSR